MTQTFLQNDATGERTPVMDREALMAQLRRDNAQAQARAAAPDTEPDAPMALAAASAVIVEVPAAAAKAEPKAEKGVSR